MDDRRKHIRFVVACGLVILLDQITKWLVLIYMPLHTRIPVIPGFGNLVHVQNPGGAFGILSDASPLVRIFLFIGVACIAAGLVVYLHIRTPARYKILTVGFAFIFGGAIGNLIDRVLHGKVIDFIDLYIGRHHWPAFNVADSAISVGMVIFAYYLIVKKVPE